MKAGAWSDGINALIRRDIRELELSLSGEDTVRGRPRAKQEEGSRQKLSMLAP